MLVLLLISKLFLFLLKPHREKHQPPAAFRTNHSFYILCFFLFSEWRVSSQLAQGSYRLVVHRHQLWYRLPVPAGWSENRPADARWPAHAQRPRRGPYWHRHRGRISSRPALATAHGKVGGCCSPEREVDFNPRGFLEHTVKDLIRVEPWFHMNQPQSNPSWEILRETIIERCFEMVLKTIARIPSLQKQKDGQRLKFCSERRSWFCHYFFPNNTKNFD